MNENTKNMKLVIKLLSVDTAEDLLELLADSDLKNVMPMDMDMDFSNLSEDEKQFICKELGSQLPVLKTMLSSQAAVTSAEGVNRRLKALNTSLDLSMTLGFKDGKAMQHSFYKELQEVGFTEKQSITLVKKIQLSKLFSNEETKNSRLSDILDGLEDSQVETFQRFFNPILVERHKEIRENEILSKLANYLRMNYTEGITAGFSAAVSFELLELDVETI